MRVATGTGGNTEAGPTCNACGFTSGFELSELRKRGILSSRLSGLTDARLSRAIAAMHREPEREWSLEQLATEANMSRARFAASFRVVVGITPFDYLTDWRIGVAQGLLKRGESLKLVAPSVGFRSSTAFTRAFACRTGLTPTEWLRRT